ncbi:Rv3654c family TadE-like protein [Pedococcus sp. NPDC057267]|uniref:Rv3654c family TadE-like protein n=1 Tax=Pedococcus sp. NPDC057267 TaxID=3346077 RepID=UPI00363780AD
MSPVLSRPVRPRRGSRHRHRHRPRRAHDQGSGTVLMVGVVAALFLLTVAGVAVASAVLAAHRARAAADLAALSGAVALGQGGAPSSACGAARVVAGRNGAVLVACSTGADGSLLVRTSTRVTVGVPAQPRAATALARAGPTQ